MWTRLAVLAVAMAAASARGDSDIPAVSFYVHWEPRLSDEAFLNAPVCRTPSPDSWRDASAARFFATGPTARLDAQELAAGAIAPLISLRFGGGTARMIVLGSPIRSGLHFTTSGWRPRWPLC